MTLIEKDQEVYVTSVSILGDYEEPTLTKYVVVDANKSSFYAVPEGEDAKYKKRFTQKELLHKSGLGYDYYAYRTEEEFWNLIERAKKTRTLRKELKEKIDSMKLEELEEATAFIDSLK